MLCWFFCFVLFCGQTQANYPQNCKKKSNDKRPLNSKTQGVSLCTSKSHCTPRSHLLRHISDSSPGQCLAWGQRLVYVYQVEFWTFYLASTHTVGLLIKSKVFSTKGGVTEVSDSSVWHVWLEDFTTPAVV